MANICFDKYVADMKDIDDDHTKTQGNVTNNSLFVGSTAALQKMLKKGFLNNKESETDK